MGEYANLERAYVANSASEDPRLQSSEPDRSISHSPSATETSTASQTKLKKKICCACPDTKQARDDCIIQNGEDACAALVEAHKVCLRSEGFNV